MNTWTKVLSMRENLNIAPLALTIHAEDDGTCTWVVKGAVTELGDSTQILAHGTTTTREDAKNKAVASALGILKIATAQLSNLD